MLQCATVWSKKLNRLFTDWCCHVFDSLKMSQPERLLRMNSNIGDCKRLWFLSDRNDVGNYYKFVRILRTVLLKCTTHFKWVNVLHLNVYNDFYQKYVGMASDGFQCQNHTEVKQSLLESFRDSFDCGLVPN